MTTHREPPPVNGKKYTAIIVHGAPSRFVERKEIEGVTDLYLWRDKDGDLCAAWEIQN